MDSESTAQEQSFIAIFDRVKQAICAVHAFKPENGSITCLKFGPYDNGHIVVGFENGSLSILDSVTLEKLLDKDLFPVNNENKGQAVA